MYAHRLCEIFCGQSPFPSPENEKTEEKEKDDGKTSEALSWMMRRNDSGEA